MTAIERFSAFLAYSTSFLDTHLHRGGQSCILGHADNLRVETVTADGEEINAVVGEITFSKAYSGTQAEINVLGGHVWGLSVGYEPISYEVVKHGLERKINGKNYYGCIQVVSRFEIREVSLTPMPKDQNCKIIIQENKQNENNESQ